MTDTSRLVNNALKVSLVLEGLKFKGDISKSTRVTPDFIRLKGKMTPADIETVLSYLEQDTEKLRDVSITVWLMQSDGWIDYWEPLPYWSLIWGIMLVRRAERPT